MSAFSYKAYDSRGALVRGEIDAPSREEALSLVRARGLIPFQAEAHAGGMAQSSIVQRRRAALLSRKSAALFFREIAVLIAADLRVDQALDIAAQQLGASQHSAVVKGLRERVRQGQSLSAAMRDFPDSFHSFEIALIRNGETRGDLAGAAEMAADLLERTLAIRGRLISAMIYPAILSLTAVGAILVVALVLAPTILPMYERGGASPPFAFSLLIAFSNLLRNWWWAILLVTAASAVWAGRSLRNVEIRRRADRLVLSLPVFGSTVANMEAARVCRTLASLLRAGAPLSDALAEAAEVTDNRVFKDQFSSARDKVRQGASLSGALLDLREFPATLRHFMAVGEQTGKLHEMLAHGAEHADAAATRNIDRLMTSLSPILTLVMGLIVGSLIAVVLSSILGANDLLIG